MKKKHTYLIVIAALLIAVTASVASVVITMIKMPPKGSISIVWDGKEHFFDPAKASTIEVSGVTVNAKGETKNVEARGYLLKDVISLVGIQTSDYTSANVTASDSMSASLTYDEIAAPDKVFLTEDKSDNGDTTLRLTVFGDKDSKRQVKNVVRIDLIK